MSRTLLAIESSTDWLSVALLADEEVLVFEEHTESRQHASSLLPMIDGVLTRGGLGLGDLNAIGVATGPGSFTSLRIGLATVKGLALGSEIVAVGVSTLEAMAFSVFEAVPAEAQVVALLDARRGEWYAGGWSRPAQPGGLPVSTLPEGLYDGRSVLAELDRETVAMCPDGEAWRRLCDEAGASTEAMVSSGSARPRADAVGRLAIRRLALGQTSPVSALSARYLRRAEAEAKRLGTPVEEGELAQLQKS